MKKISYDLISQTYNKFGYVFFNKKPYDINIFGVRQADMNQQSDSFNDILGCAYLDSNGKKNVEIWPATTDPGLRHLTNPVFAEAQKNGTAILCEGQYRQAYQMGFHGGGNWRHRALIQTGPVSIYRDNNRDKILNVKGVNIQTGYFGINIHAASLWKVEDKIGLYQAGCQVIQRPDDFFRLLDLCDYQIKHKLGNKFTYTLFRNDQI